MQKPDNKLPSWLTLVAGLLGVAVVGVLDSLTGDYSLLIFYAVPVAVVAWSLGRPGAVAISLASGIARLVSDYISYSSYSSSGVRYWNSLQDMIFLLMVGLLLAWVKKLVTEDQRPMDD